MTRERTATPGPWYVLDFRATRMRELGWVGPAVDRILITNKPGAELAACEGVNSVIARIQFDNCSGELGEVSIADAHLIAAAPDLFAAADAAFDFLGGVNGASQIRDQLLAAISRAESTALSGQT